MSDRYASRTGLSTLELMRLSALHHTTVGELGEAGILDLLSASYQGLTSGDGVIGPGDDAAVIPAPGGHFVIATDAMNEGHHFLRTWPSGITDNGYSTGWKLAAQNLSDMNAMGAVTSSVSVSLAMPTTTPAAWVFHFGRGIANACRWLGASQTVISGGDLTRAETIATAITATANLIGQPVLRKAAEDVAGFHLIHTGNAGMSHAGYVVASQGTHNQLRRDELQALRLFLRPRPPLDQGPKVAGVVSAMMDVSDSILTDADRLAAANNLHAHIDPAWVARTAAHLQPLADRYDADASQWVLTGGEDYGLLAILNPEHDLPAGWEIIGQLTSQPQERPATTGWDHF
ncbi:thiamine-phosphate kinase [Enteractinococcus coprophilus]